MAEQHDDWMAHLRRQVVSRRTLVRGAVGGAAGSLLFGTGSRASATVLTDTGTIAGGFVVNGRHLSFGADPSTQMWAGGQLINLNHYNALPPRSVRVWLDYGTDVSYGRTVQAEVRELITHVPVWDGKPGALHASRTLNADQFFVHAPMTPLMPGRQYHYRFRYTSGRETGATPDATFITAPIRRARSTRSRSPPSATRASPARTSARTGRCGPSPTGASGTTAATRTTTRTTPRART
jgi:hypothetical protein